MADLAGAETPEAIDGVSMLPTLLGGTQPAHAPLYWELSFPQHTTDGQLRQAVRLGDWKGVRNAPGTPLELYDLASDIGETTDVAAVHPQIVAEIETIMVQGRSAYQVLPTPIDLPDPRRIPQGDWSVMFVDSEEPTTPATLLLDDDPRTRWHTQFTGAAPGHPHELQIDMGTTYPIAGFRFLPKLPQYVFQPSVLASWNGRIRDFEFYVSEDGVDWGSPVATGSWINSPGEKEVLLSESACARYVRLISLSEVNGNPWASGTELNVIRPDLAAPQSAAVPKDGWSVHFVDSEETVGTDAPAAYMIDGDLDTRWHTEWFFGSPFHPHEIQVDLGQSYLIEAFGYVPRLP